MIIFAREFLNLRIHRWFGWGSRILIAWALLLSLATLLIPLAISYQLIFPMLFIYSVLSLVAGLMAWYRGQTAARFLIADQLSSSVSLIVMGLAIGGVIRSHLLVGQSPALGTAVDVMLFSLALGDRIRVAQRAQIDAEEQARHNLAIRSEELERLVIERTSEIKRLHGILPICAILRFSIRAKYSSYAIS